MHSKKPEPGLPPFSFPEQPQSLRFVSVMCSAKRHFKTSSTGDENGLPASQLLFLFSVNRFCVREMYSEFHFACLDVVTNFFIEIFENTTVSPGLLQRGTYIQ